MRPLLAQAGKVEVDLLALRRHLDRHHFLRAILMRLCTCDALVA
jgi:hypothetical protein